MGSNGVIGRAENVPKCFRYKDLKKYKKVLDMRLRRCYNMYNEINPHTICNNSFQ